MAGRITKAEQQLEPDPRHDDKVLSRFINCMMKGGNKATAIRIVYNAFDEIQKRLDDGKAPDLPEKAIEVFGSSSLFSLSMRRCISSSAR